MKHAGTESNVRYEKYNKLIFKYVQVYVTMRGNREKKSN